jgi:PAS domain S-box-containing protein
MNRRGEIQDANQAAANLTGYTLAELRTLAVDDLLHMGEIVRQQNGDLLWPSESPQEVLLRHKDGTIIPLEWTVSTLHLGQQSVLVATAQDVHAQKPSDQAIQSLVDQLHLAIDTAKLGIWRLNVETGHLEWNDQLLAIYGLSRQEFQTHLNGWRAQLHPDDAIYANSRLAEAAEGKSVYDVEFRVIRPNGEIRTVNASAAPIYNSAHKLIELIGVNIDVTSLRKDEESLHEKESFLRAIFDNSLNAIMVADHEGNYISVNPAAADMFGYSVDQLNCMNVADLRAARGSDAAARYEQYLKSGQEIGEFEFTHTDGKIRMAQYHATRIAQNLHVSILADITEQKQAEQEVRASEARFRALFSAIPVPIYAWQRVDNDFILVDYNEVALSNTDGQIVQLVGSKASELYRDEPHILKDFDLCFQQKTILQREMTYQLRSTGKNKTFNVRYAYVPHDMILVHTEDVTEQRRSEAMLREHEERLQLVLNGADLGYWDWNIQTGEVAFNERWATMLGYTLSEIEPHVDSYNNLLHPEDQKPVMDTLFSHMRREIPFYETEHRLLARDGSWRWILSRGKVMTWDEQGTPLRAAGTHLDITERKQIEQTLLESEERFRSLMQQSPLPTAIFAPDGTMLEGNSALIQLWNLPPEAASADVAVNALTSEYPVTLGIDGYVRKAFSGEPVIIPPYESDAAVALEEYGIVVHNTQKRWIRSHYYPIKDTQGNLTYVVLVHEDVTEQKRADDALKEAQERFESAFFHSPVAMNMMNILTGERRAMNDRFVDLIGYSREEYNSHTYATLNIFANPGAREEAVAHLLAHRSLYHYPAQIKTKQGHVKHVLAYVTLLDSIEEGLALTSWIDVTELNRTQESLRQLNKAIEQSPVSVVITDTAGKIEYVNPKFCEVTGYRVEETLGQNPNILKSGVHPPEFYRQMWETIRSGKVWRGEIQNKKKNGELYWEWATIAGVKDQHGTITHYVSVKEDITERRRLEEAHARQERLAAVGQMAAGIAHDFNNILAVIVIYAQMLSRSTEIPKRLQERAAVIYQQTIHASNLVQQILDFSRRSNLEKQPFNLLPLLKEQIKLLTRTLPEDINLLLDYTDEEYMLNADPTRMQQIVTNLALNARDAMPNGGTLRMSLSKVSFHPGDPLPIVGMATGEWLKLSVADTGTGMNAEILEHILEPFFTTKERGRGTGLGLAQVYGIVKQHGGYIDVTSHVGAGTTFDIYFTPLLHSAHPHPLLNDIFDLPQGAGQHILIVEDESELRLVLGELLTSWNYHVFTAENGLEAQQILAAETGSVDLVITDFIMPHMGGSELLTHIQEKYPQIPVLVMTGHLDADRMVKVEGLGLKTWLSKPINVPDLAQVVAELLNNKP